MKQTLRKEIKKRFQSVDFNQRKDADAQIQKKALSFLFSYSTIGIYLSTDNEVDTSDIIKVLQEKNIRIVAPVCEEDFMYFCEYHPEHTTVNRYGIKEPTGKIVSSDDIDLLLVPLVAFDSERNRLGHGKGYYDKYLKDYKGKTIGLAYSFQKAETVYPMDHDISLNIIITEDRIY